MEKVSGNATIEVPGRELPRELEIGVEYDISSPVHTQDTHDQHTAGEAYSAAPKIALAITWALWMLNHCFLFLKIWGLGFAGSEPLLINIGLARSAVVLVTLALSTVIVIGNLRWQWRTFLFVLYLVVVFLSWWCARHDVYLGFEPWFALDVVIVSGLTAYAGLRRLTVGPYQN